MEQLHRLVEPETVLVVDDAPENLMLLTQALADQYRVRAARDGEGALRVASSEPRSDLILRDIVMPGLDGFEVCRRLKADPASASIPVIFLTARSKSEDNRNKCFECLLRPFGVAISGSLAYSPI